MFSEFFFLIKMFRFLAMKFENILTLDGMNELVNFDSVAVNTAL